MLLRRAPCSLIAKNIVTEAKQTFKLQNLLKFDFFFTHFKGFNIA